LTKLDDFGGAQAERLLRRAGFGPRNGEPEALAELGLTAAVDSLLDPPDYAPTGPEPTDAKGRPLAPRDAAGHDHVWWLDRMVRGNQPLVERMTLVWHDWFATSNQGVGSQALMLDQNQLFRANWAGSFRDLLLAVTQNPAMLLWLNGNRNRVGRPNENYAREMMELFTLGADQGYTEQDVREQARALTDWSYFIPVSELDPATAGAFQQAYVASGYQVAPLLRSILLHPALYEGPRMVKPPVVYTAGLLRALGRAIDTTDWTTLDAAAGQQLFYPPNVAGWDDDRWLDTQTYRARWAVAQLALGRSALDPAQAPRETNTADAIVARALTYWNDPKLSPATIAVLKSFAGRALGDAGKDANKRKTYPTLVENAMRQLIAVTPDYLTC